MVANPSLVLKKIDEIVFENQEAPTITEPTDVIVQVKKTGICGSDIHFYQHGKIGNYILTKPMVLGHESAGVVTEVGPGVKNLHVGDNVAIEPGVPSRFSDAYKSGRYNLCPHMRFAATPSTKDEPNPPGTLCKYFKSPEDFLVKLPDHVSLELGAMVEPLSVGVHACKIGRVKFGDTVAVFGAGPVGLLTAATAKTFGTAKVIIIDVFDNKLQMAKDIGVVTHTFNSKTDGDYNDLIQHFGGQPNVVLECTGANPCVGMGVNICAPGGTFIQVGNAATPVKFPITEFAMKELTLYGSFRYGFGDYQDAVNIFDANYKNGKDKAPIDFERLITHRFKFDDAIKAYDLVRSGCGAVKCLIDGPE